MPEFNSTLGDMISLFIKQKQAAGYPYENNILLLKRFDAMVAEQFTHATTITREIADAWIAIKPDEHPNCLLRRVTPVRQLGKFMQDAGIPTFIVPGSIPRKQIKYVPHIFTKTELNVFFDLVDSYDYSYCDGMHLKTAKYVVPTIFRVYYGLGLRNSEARLLLTNDVDLETGEILIRESKGWKQRVVVAGKDVILTLRGYDRKVSSLLPRRDYFFPKENGTPYSAGTIDRWFNFFWNKTPDSKTTTGNKPRIHDFRHTHCVHLLNYWFRNGKDLNALYPYLSEHLGHSHFADTDYYLTLREEFFPDVEKMMKSLNEKVLPEVFDEEK